MKQKKSGREKTILEKEIDELIRKYSMMDKNVDEMNSKDLESESCVQEEKDELEREKEKLMKEKEKQETERMRKVEFMKFEESSLNVAEKFLLLGTVRSNLVNFLKGKNLYSDFCSRLSQKVSKTEKVFDRQYKGMPIIDPEECYVNRDYYTYYFDGEIIIKDAMRDKEGFTYDLSEEEKKEKIGQWFIDNDNIPVMKIIDLLVEKYDINLFELYSYCVLFYLNQRKYETLRSFTWKLEELGIKVDATQDENALYAYKDVVNDGNKFVEEVKKIEKRKYQEIFKLCLILQENKELCKNKSYSIDSELLACLK